MAPRLPFRAEHIGSLLRPAAVKEARLKRERGEIAAEALRAVEDEAIRAAIARQEALGLQSVSDGELRRASFSDFLGYLDGIERQVGAEGIKFQNITTRPRINRIVGKLGFTTHPMIADFAFLKEHTKRTPKMTIASPTMLFPLARDPAELLDTPAYRRRDEVFPDLVRAYRAGIRALYDVGCRSLQLDECNLSVSCDPAYRQRIRDRGEDPERVIGAYVDLINDAVSDRPRDMMVAMHHCRGNFRSSWMAEGGYEPIADLLFNKVDIDVHFMEYDDQRSGGFEPLRLMPKDKYLVLGLISSKRGQLEAKDEIKRRIDEASRYVDAARLCLSPQCGFSSTEEGNVLSEDEQWAKLALTLEIADEVWGRA